MLSGKDLIKRLDQSLGGDRRLDSEVTAFVVGPYGCVIDPVEGIDGWDINFGLETDGEPTCWREAADIQALTLTVDAAVELLSEARQSDSGVILMKALRRAASAGTGDALGGLVSRVARSILVELVETVVAARMEPVAQAA